MPREYISDEPRPIAKWADGLPDAFVNPFENSADRQLIGKKKEPEQGMGWWLRQLAREVEK